MSGTKPPTFVAIDFETADTWPDSACAVALVRVENDRIVQQESSLIRPPRAQFMFTRVHGISWHHVADKPIFAEAWPRFSYLLEDADFFVAHNAGFDRSVLTSCCRAAKIAAPSLPFRCTMALARKKWGLRPTRLPDVCDFLSIPLKHHDPVSDAEACAQIMLHVLRQTIRV
jgi:DNA polymerase-3 subunit epsilon